MFLDNARIDVTGGSGGNGCVSWRREKYVSKGGPDGGDGGKGGDIILQANGNTDTLSNFASKKRYAAPDGAPGTGSRKHGKNGEDLVLFVPPGTLIYDAATNQLVADLVANGDQVVLAKGGRGGFGNAHFKSSTRQKPDFAEQGEPGQQLDIQLELKLVADVGIIGLPSVGKSTLISVISSAKPKIAAYPFTTLVPNLGVVPFHDRSMVVCDVPGLIEGASEGKGLGEEFLKHVERCGALLHLLDLSHALQSDGTLDPAPLIVDYKTIRQELAAYSPTLDAKREILAIAKSDLTTEDLSPLLDALKAEGLNVEHVFSSATKTGIDELLALLMPIVIEERAVRKLAETEVESEIVLLKPHQDTGRVGSFTIEEEETSVVVRGDRLEQLTVMTNMDSEGGIRRLLDVLDRISLLNVLRRKKTEGKSVFIGSVNVTHCL